VESKKRDCFGGIRNLPSKVERREPNGGGETRVLGELASKRTPAGIEVDEEEKGREIVRFCDDPREYV